MTRHAIDEVLANARSRSARQPVLRPVSIADPYRSAKTTLLAAIGDVNNVRVIVASRSVISLVGFASDLDATEMLFASLLVQATREMHVAASRVTDGRLRAFRHAFFVSFGSRIGGRLREAMQDATVQAEASFGASLVPLLGARTEAVEDFLKDTYPRLRNTRTTLSHRGGWLTGRAAADRADLGTGRLDAAPRP